MRGLRLRLDVSGALVWAALSLLLCSCSPAPQPADPVLRARSDKDASFRDARGSPLTESDRGAFQSLRYYPLNPSLRFRVQLHRHPVPEQIRLGTSTGETRQALRYGYFEFSVAGQACRLQAYRTEDGQNSGEPYLFVPFRDATSGSETYASGRYIDLRENTTGIYDLDFNRAYNPLCAYNERYSCPVPPAENTLTVPVRAGEKSFRSGAH